MWEIVLIRGLGMAGTIYGIKSSSIVDGKFTRKCDIAGVPVLLTYRDTGETKRKGDYHRRVFELLGIKSLEG